MVLRVGLGQPMSFGETKHGHAEVRYRSTIKTSAAIEMDVGYPGAFSLLIGSGSRDRQPINATGALCTRSAAPVQGAEPISLNETSGSRQALSGVVETRRIELPTFALRTRRSPS